MNDENNLLNLDDLSVEQQYFYNVLKNAKYEIKVEDKIETETIPLTQEDYDLKIQKLADNADLTIANKNKYSAFWNFTHKAITEPVQWLTAYLIRHIIPQLYVKTAVATPLDTLAAGYNLKRYEAIKAVGNITFTRQEGYAKEITISKGTVIKTIPINGNCYKVLVEKTVKMASNVNQLEVRCIAEKAGSDYNLGTGYYSILEVLDNGKQLEGIKSVTNKGNWQIVTGTNEESDYNLRIRIRNIFASVGNWHTDAKYKSMISEQLKMPIENIYINHTSSQATPGSAEIYLLSISDDELTKIKKYILDEGNHGHGDNLTIKKVPSQSMDISLDVKCDPKLLVTDDLDKTLEEQKVIKMAELKTKLIDFVRCAFRGNNDYVEFVTQINHSSVFSWGQLTGEMYRHFPAIKTIKHNHQDIECGLEVYTAGNVEINLT